MNEPNAVELILELHKADKEAVIGDRVWKRVLDAHWTFWVNGNPETGKGGTDDLHDIPPYDCYVEFNGWPAGLFSIVTGEGCLAAGSLANYDSFCQGLKKAIEEKRHEETRNQR